MPLRFAARFACSEATLTVPSGQSGWIKRGEGKVSGFPSGIWRYPTEIRFGVGAIAELPSAVKASGIKRPLVVTDNGLAANPMIADARARLDGAGLPNELFSQVRGNPV